MPELPEVETITIALRSAIENAIFTDVRTYTEKLRYPLDLDKRKKEFAGCRITDIRRRARYIILEFSNRVVMIFHLGMTGSMRISQKKRKRLKHDHVVFSLSDGRRLVYSDPRRFGWITLSKVSESGQDPADLADLGPEPLTRLFSAKYLHSHTRNSIRNIKTLIMDNRIVVGVGNIYANEALFFCGLHPLTPANRLTHDKCRELTQKIKEVLKSAIKAGGTTIQDFRGLTGEEGHFHHNLHVYGRETENCLKCGRHQIRRIVISGRSAFFCPYCQQQS